ncbi:hypothetical protein R1flu_003609 [Riccia fluitans]|uniref:Uncharacterized protein n=1 Tax=Riccia fluitans TaxID=41844 RepID=A0ABD1YD51_9MARC
MKLRAVSQDSPPYILSTDGDTVYLNRSLECDSDPLPWRQLLLGIPSACYKVINAGSGYFLMRSRLDVDEHGQCVYFLLDPLCKDLKKVPTVPSPALEGVFKPTRYVEAFTPSGKEGVESSTAKLILIERFSVRQVEYRRVENWRVHCYDAGTGKLDLVSDVSQPPVRVYRLSNEGRLQEQVVKARFLKVMNATLVGTSVYILARPDHAKECPHNTLNPESCMNHRYGHFLLKASRNLLQDESENFLRVAPFAQLFQHRGSLHLAVGRKIASRLPFEVHIWKNIMARWTVLSRMPEDLVYELCERMTKAELFRVQIEGEYVCFSRWIDSEVFIFYHLVGDYWKLVKLPDFRASESDGEIEKEPVIPGGQTQQVGYFNGTWYTYTKKKYFRPCLWGPLLSS